MRHTEDTLTIINHTKINILKEIQITRAAKPAVILKDVIKGK